MVLESTICESQARMILERSLERCSIQAVVLHDNVPLSELSLVEVMVVFDRLTEVKHNRFI